MPTYDSEKKRVEDLINVEELRVTLERKLVSIIALHESDIVVIAGSDKTSFEIARIIVIEQMKAAISNMS